MTGRPELAALQAGDRVGIVFPSGPPDPERLKQAEELLRSWDLVPVPGRNVLRAHPRADYLAGSDAERASDLEDAWCDDTLQAVFCARGGYGTVRLLDLLDVERLRRARPKALFGSSDVTAVHEFWAERLGLSTWFSPMIATAAVLGDAVATAKLHQAVFGCFEGRSYSGPDACTLVPGTATGVMTGGNLSLLAMTTGAARAAGPRAAGKIILLEDVTEDLYRIDALLHTLLRSGYFDGAAGIVLGTWHECGDLGAVRALLQEVLSPLGIPLVWGFPLGHGPAADSIPLGVPAVLDAGTEPLLTLIGARKT